ncbi:type I toxin-antitoxin system Fst family toxin [Enterococcus sp. DIV1409a]|uniref:type I toxin-antitoxin system Fst family toxin n=1 Tax=Enterococcus sp. DIV1409a TaxID=2774954 RepID=UPI003F68377A
MKDLMSLVIAPIFVGLVLEMISRVLDEEDDNGVTGTSIQKIAVENRTTTGQLS